MAEIVIKEIDYRGYGKSVMISNGKIEAIATVDIGPRIIRFGFVGGDNELCEIPIDEVPEKNQSSDWQLMGGHRLWHSPEHKTRTYVPDNGRVEWQEIENGIILSQKTEPWVQIKKEMEITMSAENNKMTVLHRLINKNAWDVELAAWSLSIMAPGGKEIIPQPMRDSGLLPNRVIALWPYSKMNDSRVYWGDKYIVVTQDKNAKNPFKLGISNESGQAAYFNHNNLFIKSYSHIIGADYTDFGVSYETYTNDFMLEMETLSPLKKLAPDEELIHIEEWQLIENIPMPLNDEKEICSILKRYANF